ncbi:MAG: Rho termination factor N-terminal domain-containing protein [Solirubrobacteraceae bacterium]
MSVVQRSALDASPLADLHALAGALNIDGYRRLRKSDLIGAILERQGGEDDTPPAPAASREEGEPARRPRRRRAAAATNGSEQETSSPEGEEQAAASKPRAAGKRSARPRRASAASGGGAAASPRRSANAAAGDEEAEVEGDPGDGATAASGVVELLPNGSGFLRLAPAGRDGAVPEPSDDDVYISAAQARRCELVSGDRVSGPARAARRSERHPSLIRIEQINGVAAEQAVSSTRIDEREVDFPSEPLSLGEEDPTLAAIGFLAPFGRGSRVLVHGPARSGKSEAIKRLAGVLAGIEGLQVEVLLVGIRPEELGEWKASTIATVSGHSFAASAGVQAAAMEQAVERGGRIAARGGDAVLLIDTLTGAEPAAARRALAAARKLKGSGSLTIIATAYEPYGGETTVIALDRERAASGRLPAVDPLASGTVRAELLVGLERFQEIAKARSEHPWF